MKLEDVKKTLQNVFHSLLKYPEEGINQKSKKIH